MLKKALLLDENRNPTKHRMGFLQFCVKTKKYADVLPILAQNKSILHMACTYQRIQKGYDVISHHSHVIFLTHAND